MIVWKLVGVEAKVARVAGEAGTNEQATVGRGQRSLDGGD